MKIKGLRWIVLALIAIVTIINYLDRGTLNYMWVANTKVVCAAGDYTYDAAADTYAVESEGKALTLAGDEVTKLPDGAIEYVKYGGIAKELGLIDPSAPAEEQQRQAKSLLAVITMFFMVAYGVSQLVSGKVYDRIGTRRGFTLSALLWGGVDALASLASGLKSLTFFRVMLGLGEAGPWPGTTKSNAEWFPQKERAFAQGIFGAAASVGSIIAPVLIPVLLIFVVKELGMLIGGCFLLKRKKRPCAAKWYGKVGTVMFYISAVVVVVQGIFNMHSMGALITAYTLLGLTAAFMIYTMIRYFLIFLQILHSEDPRDNLDLNKEIKARKGENS